MDSYSFASGRRWYAFSLKNQARMAVSLRVRRRHLIAANGDRREGPDALDQRGGLLEVREVAGASDRLEMRAGNRRAIRVAVAVRRDEPVVGAPEEQRGHVDPMQPPPELRVVEVWLPGVEGRR